VVAGGSANSRARREREYAAELMRRYQRAQAVAARYEAAAVGEQHVAAALLALTGAGWTLLVDRRWPGSAVANVDMILVGPGGVFVIDVKNWRVSPTVIEGQLHAGHENRHQEISKLRAITSMVQDELAILDMTPAVAAAVMVFANHCVDQRVGTVFLRGVKEVAPWLAALPRRLAPQQATRVALVRVQEAADQGAAGDQDAVTLGPHRGEVRDEQRRDGVYQQVEALVGQAAEIGHVSMHGGDVKAVSLAGEPVLVELLGRQVYDGDPGASGRQDRRLLSAAGSQAEHPGLGERRQPVSRHRPLLADSQRPLAAAGRGDFFGGDNLGVRIVTAVDGVVPRTLVEVLNAVPEDHRAAFCRTVWRSRA
jgi:hypothetical protein